jgi:hypothetical protein
MEALPMSRIFDRDNSDMSFAYETVVKVLDQWHEAHRAEYIRSGYTQPNFDTQEEKHGHIGGKYMRLDVGGSGAWMLEMATGDVYQIKGYGKIDKKKCGGNIYAPDFDGSVLFRDRFRHGRFDNRKKSMLEIAGIKS